MIYFEDDLLNSILPPYDVGGGDGSQEKIRVELTALNHQSGKVSCKMYGTELALSKNEEGVEHTMDMQLFIEKIKERKNLIKIPVDQQKNDQLFSALA